MRSRGGTLRIAAALRRCALRIAAVVGPAARLVVALLVCAAGSTAASAQATSVSISSSVNPSVFGQAVSFTATVTATSGGGTPDGTVTFFDGDNGFGVGILSGGTAIFTTSELATGTHTIQAIYSGQGTTFTPSISPTLTQTVRAANQSQVTIVSAAVGRDGQFTFSSTISGASSFSLTTRGGTATQQFQNLSGGTFTVTQARPPAGWKLTSVQCNGVTQTGATATIVLTGSNAVTCTFTNTFDAQIVQAGTQAPIRSFLQHRANAIAASEPDGTRGNGRLTGWLFGGGDDEGPSAGSPTNLMGRTDATAVDRGLPASLREGSVGSGSSTSSLSSPFRVSGSADDGSGTMLFSTSLSQIRQAAVASEAARVKTGEPAMGLGGPLLGSGPVASGNPPAFDVWFEARTNFYDDSRGGAKQSGHTHLLYVGADYLVHPAILVGVVAQFDWAEETSSVLGTSADGQGWMVGPYVAVRLSKSITFDARAAWGQSDNHVNPFGAFTDSFSTERGLVSGRLTGNWYYGPVRLTPSASLVYFRETQHNFTDQLDVHIAQQTVTLGRFAFGPEVGYRFQVGNGSVFEPFVGLKGVWDFDRDGTTTLGGSGVDGDAWFGRAEAGAQLHTPSGIVVRGAAAYDGIGQKNFNAYQGRLLVAVPLN